MEYRQIFEHDEDTNISDSCNLIEDNASNVTKRVTVGTLKDYIKSATIAAVKESLYPVGSIHISVSNTNPSTIFGGTWVQIKDTFLLACGDTYSPGTTGGEAEHTLTVNEMPAHAHDMESRTGAGGMYGIPASSGNTTSIGNITTGSTGGGEPHNNMPPYTTVYVWKRTA